MQHIKIKPGVPLAEQAEIGHNRWHPDLPFLTSVRLGSGVRVSFPAPDSEKPSSKDGGFFLVDF